MRLFTLWWLTATLTAIDGDHLVGAVRFSQEQITTALEMDAAGHSYGSIARQIGASPNGVMLLLRREYRKALEHPAIVDMRKTEVVRKYQQVEYLLQEALRGWRRSQESTTTLKTATRETRYGDFATEETIVEERSGNPAYLAAALQAIARQCALLGLDAPVQIDVSQPPPPAAGQDTITILQKNPQIADLANALLMALNPPMDADPADEPGDA